MCKYGTEIVVPLPAFISDVVPRVSSTVCLDSCIAEDIQHLWDKEIFTLGCCCGHGKTNSGIVIGEGYSLEEVKKIRSILRTRSDREWDLFQWKITLLSNEELCIPEEG